MSDEFKVQTNDDKKKEITDLKLQFYTFGATCKKIFLEIPECTSSAKARKMWKC